MSVRQTKHRILLFPRFGRAGKRLTANPSVAANHQKTGGGGRDRTDDLRLAKPALSQLSYAPTETAAHTSHTCSQNQENGGPGKT